MTDDVIATIPSGHAARLAALAYPVTMTAADAARAADDLRFCQEIRQAVERAKTETLGPLRGRLDALRARFDAALETVRSAEARVKAALLAWRHAEAQARTQAAQQAATAQAQLAGETARQDAEMAGLGMTEAARIGVSVAATVQAQVGEAIAPAPLPATVAGETGTASVRLDWTFEVVDVAQVPRAFLSLDEALVRAAIRAGTRELPGLRIYARETIVGRRR